MIDAVRENHSQVVSTHSNTMDEISQHIFDFSQHHELSEEKVNEMRKGLGVHDMTFEDENDQNDIVYENPEVEDISNEGVLKDNVEIATETQS